MYAKKSLGQNFLKSDKAIRQIVEASKLEKGETVLEIGPGLGVLTRALLEQGAHVIAVEKDDRLIITLHEMFHNEISSQKLTIIHADILDLVEKNTMNKDFAKLLGSKYKLIANIPYYITGEIIQRFHTVPNQPETMVLMVQKEVAQRIVGLPIPGVNKKNEQGKESILSIAVKMYGIPKIISIVPRGAFSPAPNVDSAILAIYDIKHFGKLEKEKEFFEILHASFAHKRKYMLSNIKTLPNSLQDKVINVLNSYDFNEKVRAEDVSISIWNSLAEKL